MDTTPKIADVLDAFFSDASVGKTACTRARYSRTEAALLRYLDDIDIAAWLGPDIAHIALAEREFDPVNAFARTMSADELIVVLPGFVDAGRLPACRADARTQISLTDRLVGYLTHFRLVDALASSTPILRTQVACADARVLLNQPAEPRLFG